MFCFVLLFQGSEPQFLECTPKERQYRQTVTACLPILGGYTERLFVVHPGGPRISPACTSPFTLRHSLMLSGFLVIGWVLTMDRRCARATPSLSPCLLTAREPGVVRATTRCHDSLLRGVKKDEHRRKGNTRYAGGGKDCEGKSSREEGWGTLGGLGGHPHSARGDLAKVAGNEISGDEGPALVNTGRHPRSDWAESGPTSDKGCRTKELENLGFLHK